MIATNIPTGNPKQQTNEMNRFTNKAIRFAICSI